MNLNKRNLLVLAVVSLSFFLIACENEACNPETIEESERFQELTEEEAEYDQSYETLISEWKATLDKYKREEYDRDRMLSPDLYSYDSVDLVKYHYALYDIDGNGVSELILNKRDTDENIIAYIFTMKEEKPVNIFGYDDDGKPEQVPWSRAGGSYILETGLIDSSNGDYAIYKMSDDGYFAEKIADAKPYDYVDEASIGEGKWRHYVNGEETDRDTYILYLKELGYEMGWNIALAEIEWIEIIS